MDNMPTDKQLVDSYLQGMRAFAMQIRGFYTIPGFDMSSSDEIIDTTIAGVRRLRDQALILQYLGRKGAPAPSLYMDDKEWMISNDHYVVARGPIENGIFWMDDEARAQLVAMV